MVDFTKSVEIKFVKTDEEARVVYGWASVITEKGVPVLDLHGDRISCDEMMKAATDFMQDSRVAKAMHEGDSIGEILHSFPLTKELASSLGIVCEKEGWIVGMKVHDDDVWGKIKSGAYSAFSIGGTATFEADA